ncbi:LysR substrate-binding domain-containing protein [Pantoea dispersa]|uniref:LysR substrate-binding domain-containing protein n=1 Tax=Pantoea dispersa TaxID=59814 RepID=UPI002DBDA31B|nr:LysR substrate-binding domain-containing protein [Pantoea dispersa]MEB5837517.1 LysR substrate-binding domain-containing protein [Pantoea dispersa]
MSSIMRKYADIPSLKCLQVFEQIARAGNVLRAAETLGITASAASHQLAKLEKSLGCQLFDRNAAGVKLNSKGEAYLAMIGVHLQGLMQASEEMKDSDKLNRIRIHSSPTFGYMWLLPRLESFQDQCPGIEVTLACSYEEIDFSRGEVDIAIRHGLPVWEGCEIISVRDEHIMPMASPEYLAQAPVKSLYDLMTRRLIYSESTLLRWPEWFRMHHLNQPAQPWLLRFDRSYMSIEAAVMGHGIVLESDLLAGRFLEEGKLVRVLPDNFTHAVNAHHIVTPVGYRNRPVIQQFLSWTEMSLRGEIVRP